MSDTNGEEPLVQALGNIAQIGYPIRDLTDAIKKLTEALNEDIALRKGGRPG